MNPYLQSVTEFHRAFSHPIGERPSLTDNDLVTLRTELLAEELEELGDALCDYDKVATLDALCDLQVVLSGAIIALGFQHSFDEAFRRVMQSNMSKLGEDGKPIYRADGKILKGPNYQPPNLNDLV